MKKLFVIPLIFHSIGLFCQSSVDNIEKYWSYRDRLRKNFMRIGNNPGESIPMSARSIGFAFGGAPLNENELRPSRVYYTDATIYLGHYLAVLGTESKLLIIGYSNEEDPQKAQKILNQVESTKNELFYALSAINRLDINAENHLSNYTQELSLDDLNGFFLRDDVPKDFHLNFSNDYSEIFDRSADFTKSHGDFDPVDMYGTYAGLNFSDINLGMVHEANVMSLDQITSILMGLVTVHKMVPETWVVQPTENDVPMNLRDEARNIALRIIDYVTNDVYTGIVYDGMSFNVRNWDGLFRPAGYDLTGAAPFLVKIALELGDPFWLSMQANDQIQDLRVAIQVHPQKLLDLILEPGYLPCEDYISDLCDDGLTNGQPITVGTISLGAIFALTDELEGQWVEIEPQGNPCILINNNVEWAINDINIDIEGIDCDNTAEVLINVILLWLSHNPFVSVDNLPLLMAKFLGLGGEVCPFNFIEDNGSLNDDNIHIMLELATVAGLWEPDYINHISTLNDFNWYPMLYAVLHNDQIPYTYLSETTLTQNILNTAPCEGPWDDPLQASPAPGTIPGWRSQNKLFHPRNATEGIGEAYFRGEYSGIDYMLYYNLAHLLWPETRPQFERKTSCQCVEEITQEINLTSNLSVQRKFPDYAEKNIPIESYLAHSLNVANELILDINNDLIICRQDPEIVTTLTINNLSQFVFQGSNEMIIKEGNKVLISDNSTFVVGINSGSKIILEENAELIISNGSTLISYAGIEIVLNEGSKLIFENSTFDVSYGATGNSISLNGNGLVRFTNSALNISNPSGIAWNLHETASIIMENSTIEIGENSNLIFFDSSSLTIDGGYVQCNSNSKLSFYDQSELLYMGGDLSLNGQTTSITFIGGTLNILPNRTFAPLHPNFTSGFIEFTGNNDHELFTGLNSKLLLVGDNSNDVILKINNGADLWNNNFGMGILEIRNATVDLSNSGQLWTDMKFIADNVKFVDSNPPIGGPPSTVQIWHNNACSISNCEFTNSKLYTYNTRLSAYNTDFSGTKSGCKAELGSIYVSNCDFLDCSINSQSLSQNSTIVSSYFNPADAMPGVSDFSNVELKISTSTFTDSNTGGVFKEGGKLTLKCNLFTNLGTGVFTSLGQLNMSSTSFAGYNMFTNVGTCIELNAASGISLSKGYNDLSGYTDFCIEGTLDYPCTNQQCAIQLDALNNFWGIGGPNDPQFPNGLIQPYSVDITVLTTSEPSDCGSDGPWSVGCDVIFVDAIPTMPQSCGNGHIEVIPPRRNLQVNGSTKPIIDYFKDFEFDSTNPLINTSDFTDITLDSALVTAAMMMEAYDSLGNDAIAVDLFHQILTDSLNRSVTDVRWKMEWGQILMKSAVENMFLQNELSTENNTSVFENEVQKYVDVLNTMTDVQLTDSTFQSQFYLEMDKGQLFRTLNRPFMARYLFTHIDDCQLDSLQQSTLNKWLEEVDLEISLYNQYVLNGVSPDSLNFEVDTTEYNLPVQLGLDQHYFGTWIESPTDITFMACSDDAIYQSLALNKHGAFSLYPNPNSGQFNLEYMGQEGPVTCEIRDMIGNLVYSKSYYLYPFDVIELGRDIPLSNGTYSCTLRQINSKHSSRFVVYR